MPITNDEMIASYRQYLAARLTVAESPGFGGLVETISKQTINSHIETEAQYIREQLAARSSEVAELKAISHK